MYVVGELYVLIISYLSRNWQVLYTWLSSYSIVITLVIVFFLPESPKNLIVNGKYNEALKILKDIAKFNGRKFEKLNVEELISSIVENTNSNENTDEKNDRYNGNESAWYYITHPLKNLVKLALVGYIWIAISMVYFGVSLGNVQVSYLYKNNFRLKFRLKRYLFNQS